ncbi:MAG: hypothetical protein A2W99_11540 [Bacteroidetes bacterium GWF2_33_16]|nr:MAG: hypothetical protein A2X00_04200 [Bacteroidetes bacterium GWE2_32_14]OFY04159.1 MAG: hypothetical protein A2W99_11540 [Bacteroidetes bacterium GWF2_33_16]
MRKYISKSISILFHPLVLPTLSIFILFNSGTYLDFIPYNAKKVVILIVFVSTFVLPLTFVPFYLFQSIIKNIQMESNKERLVPFFISFCLYLFCYYLLYRIGSPEMINRLILAAATSILLLFILSIKWKISAHMVGIGGLTGALIALSLLLKVNMQYYIIASVLASGLIGFARLWLKAHSPKQIYIGWITGLIVTFIVLFVF